MQNQPTPRELEQSLTLETCRGRESLRYREAIMLADRLTTAGDLDGSDEIVDQLEQAFPDHAIPLVLRLHNRVTGRDHDLAVSLADRLAAGIDANPIAASLCIRAWRQAGLIDRALERARQLRARQPDLALGQHELGLCQLAAGQESEALACFNAAIRAQPEMTAPYWSRARIAAGKLSAEQIAALTELAGRDGWAPHERSHLEFALAWAYAGVDTERHFALLDRANASVAARQPWHAQPLHDRLARIHGDFDRDRHGALQAAARTDLSPVFVIGMPRSGTSLVEQILAAHDDVTGCGETGGLEKAAVATGKTLGLPDDPSLWSQAGALADAMLEFDRQYRRSLNFYRVDTPLFTDKSLASDWLAGYLLAVYPRARVIHCRRHPLDICLSVYRLFFTHGQSFSYRLAWAAEACRIHDALMAFWKSRFADRILDVDYERLVAGQREVTADMLAFCELDWQASCLDFDQQRRTARTASDHQIKKGLYRSAAGRWKAYAGYLGEAAEVLGIDPQA